MLGINIINKLGHCT